MGRGVEVVKQEELRAWVGERQRLRALQREVRLLEEQVTHVEVMLIARLGNGARQERGPLRAAVQVETGARRPKWKEEFVKRCGLQAAGEVIAATVPSESQVLVVLEDGKVA